MFYKSLLTCCFSSTIRLRTRGTVKAKLERRDVKPKGPSSSAPDDGEEGSKDELDSKEEVKFWSVLVRIGHSLVSVHLHHNMMLIVQTL